MLLSVNVDAGDKDTINAFETVGAGQTLCAAPDGIASAAVLIRGEDQRDIQSDSRGGQFFQRPDARFGRGDFDHAIGVASGPAFPQFDVRGRSIDITHRGAIARLSFGIFQQRFEFKADPARVAAGRLVDGLEFFLGIANQPVGQFPGDRFIIVRIVQVIEQRFDYVIHPTLIDDCRNNRRIAGCPDSPPGEIFADFIGMDRIEIKFGATLDE